MLSSKHSICKMGVTWYKQVGLVEGSENETLSISLSGALRLSVSCQRDWLIGFRMKRPYLSVLILGLSQLIAFLMLFSSFSIYGSVLVAQKILNSYEYK